MKGDGSPGDCAIEYGKFTKNVVSKSKRDGDSLEVTYKALAEAETGRIGTKYSVVDVDAYNGAFRHIVAGIVKLIAVDGFLFLSFPVKAAYRFPSGQVESLVHTGVNLPEDEDIAKFVIRTNLQHGYKTDFIESERFGGIRRLVFKVHAFSCYGSSEQQKAVVNWCADAISKL
jgi:hypothetical protein